MAETLTLTISIFTALGFGGIAGAYTHYLIERRKQAQSQHFEFRQRRYAATIVLMIARISPQDQFCKLTAVRPDLQEMEDLIHELDVEVLNAFLFASRTVIERLGEFIQTPSRRALIAVADAMRRDLYGRSNNLGEAAINSICGLPTPMAQEAV